VWTERLELTWLPRLRVPFFGFAGSPTQLSMSPDRWIRYRSAVLSRTGGRQRLFIGPEDW